MSILDNAEQRFVEAVANGLRELAFDKWGESIYFYPKAAMQLKQKAGYGKCLDADNDAEIALNILMYRARDKDGRKLFKPSDREKIQRKVLAEDVAEIVQEMLRIDGEDVPGK